MASWPQSSARATAAGQHRDIDWDPELKWQDSAHSYLLRLELPGFNKEQFRVNVDRFGRLTIRGERPTGYVRVNKEFQLPPTADLGRIAARFDGGVLHLAVPKLPVGAAETVSARMAEGKALAWGETVMEKEQSRWEKGDLIAAAAAAAFAFGAIVTYKLFSSKNN